MAVESPAPAPEDMSVSDSVELPSNSQQQADFATWEKELNETPVVKVTGADFLESLLDELPEFDQDGIAFSHMPEKSVSLIESKLPASARQNGAILSIIYEVEDLAPQFLGYIMGSGRTWWFVTFEEAMNSNIDYVAGFARGYVEEKLWQYTAF